jgi:hypothetical protein
MIVKDFFKIPKHGSLQGGKGLTNYGPDAIKKGYARHNVSLEKKQDGQLGKTVRLTASGAPSINNDLRPAIVVGFPYWGNFEV